jgi:hypothetical protein
MSAQKNLVIGILFGVLSVATVALVQSHTGAPQAGSLSGASANAQMVKDSMGYCQMTLPDGWRPGKNGVIFAYGPGDSKAELVVGPGVGPWEKEKATVRNFFSNLYSGQAIKVLQDDASILTFEVLPTGSSKYALIAARPRKIGYCELELTSSAPDTRIRLEADFKKMSDSVKALD